MSKDKDFMTDRLTKDAGKAFSPSRYSLKSGNDAIIRPYSTYDLFYEITFKVMQKLGAYEDIGTPEECRKAIERQIPKKPIMIKDTAETYYICSECEMGVDKVDDNYCSDCGQKLDWSSEE